MTASLIAPLIPPEPGQAAESTEGRARPAACRWPLRAWYAHITLSMLALAWLAASKAQAVKKGSAPAIPV
jgi:hypothetical protein